MQNILNTVREKNYIILHISQKFKGPLRGTQDSALYLDVHTTANHVPLNRSNSTSMTVIS